MVKTKSLYWLQYKILTTLIRYGTSSFNFSKERKGPSMNNEKAHTKVWTNISHLTDNIFTSVNLSSSWQKFLKNLTQILKLKFVPRGVTYWFRQWFVGHHQINLMMTKIHNAMQCHQGKLVKWGKGCLYAVEIGPVTSEDIPENVGPERVGACY